MLDRSMTDRPAPSRPPEGAGPRTSRMHGGRSTLPPHLRAMPKRGVLVVESDPDLQWSLARMLTMLGNRVVGTSSSDGALALLAEWPVDLVLVAEDLPGMDGLELAHHVRETVPKVPVILLANDGPGVRDAAAAAGVAAYLVKPFRLEQVRDVVLSLELEEPETA